MKGPSYALLGFTIVLMCFFSRSSFGGGVEVEEAIALLQQIHPDQCQQQKLRGQVLVAHRDHDQETLDAIYPQLEVVSKRLKPLEDRLNALKAAIKKNPQDQNAFEAALLQNADCD